MPGGTGGIKGGSREGGTYDHYVVTEAWKFTVLAGTESFGVNGCEMALHSQRKTVKTPAA